MGSFSEESSTLEDAGTEPRRGRLRSYGGAGLEKMWYIAKFEAAYKIFHL